MIPVRFDTPGFPAMHGYADSAPVEMEIVVVRHEMTDGTFALETVCRAVAPLELDPAPAEAETSDAVV